MLRLSNNWLATDGELIWRIKKISQINPHASVALKFLHSRLDNLNSLYARFFLSVLGSNDTRKNKWCSPLCVWSFGGVLYCLDVPRHQGECQACRLPKQEVSFIMILSKPVYVKRHK